jgi:O-antigen/teichoic acid export membrane protein
LAHLKSEIMSDSTTISQKATRSVKWSALTEMVYRTAAPLITVILARLLTPSDFGVVATAMIAISFAQMFWDAGLGKALIQTNEAPEDAAHIVFWTNLALGAVVYTLLFITAPWVAIFFNSPPSGPVLRVLGLQIVIASLSSVQQALLMRDLNFRRLFWVKLFTAFLPGFFSIPMALYGYGVWALVAGILTGQAVNLLLLWRYSHWRPRFQYDRILARKMFSFGLWVLVEAFGAWLIATGDNLVVGRFLGVHDLGVYCTGWMVVAVIFGLILNPFLPVLYSVFSRMQDDPPAMKENFLKVNRIVMALALPIGVGFFLIGPELATLLFGSKWQGLGLVLQILGLMFGLAWLVGINPELYRAMGRPDVNSKLMIISAIYYVPAYLMAAQSGLVTFVYVRLAVALVAIPIHVFLCCRMLNISPFYIWRDGKNFIIAAIAMIIGVGVVKWSLYFAAASLPHLLLLAFLMITGIIIYATTIWLLDRSFIMQTAHLARRAVVI